MSIFPQKALFLDNGKDYDPRAQKHRMHVILVSVGTDGDIFPFVGLGAKLRSRGHRVTLAASADYESLAARHDFAFRALVSSRENEDLFGHPDFWNVYKTVPLAARWGLRFVHRQYELLSSLVTRDAVIVANPAVFAAAMVHEKTGVPWANLLMQPWLIPSSIAPPIMPGLACLRGAPRPLWDVFWLALDCVGDVFVGRDLNRMRAGLGLRPTRRVFQNWLSKELVVGLFPDWYGPPQSDWPSQVRLTGFPMFDGGRDVAPPARLMEFCAEGSPPVAFTFGTGMAHSSDLFRAALEVCAILGVRGVFLTKYRDQLPAGLPSSVLHCEFAPFQKLFQHCSAVVHHGGIGTVAKALAAGAPQLIRPICFDQADNGDRVRRLGAGNWVKSGNGARLAKALKRVLTPETRTNCRAVAKRFETGDALESAARLIEGLV